MSKTWKVIDLLKTVSQFFEEKGIENPRLNAELLLGKVLGVNRVNLYVQFERPLTNPELDTYRELIKRRARHEPLQYLLGQTEFMGLPFNVRPGVLIPRPETEILIEETLKLKNALKDTKPIVVDIGSGSGCIAISLAKLWPQSEVYATDVSDTALQLVRENAELNQVTDNIHIVKHDIFTPWDVSLPQAMDILVSNPPYITQSEMEQLPEEIKAYEPHIALTDQANGLDFYNRFFEMIKEHLIDVRYLMLELSGTQPEKIIERTHYYDLNQIEIIPDLNGIKRVLKIKVNE